MDLAELRIFRAVVHEGGVTRAAERLHRVQSNVTTRIRQLEEKVGTPLFIREGKRLHLTPSGQLLLGFADRLLALADEAAAVLLTCSTLGPAVEALSAPAPVLRVMAASGILGELLPGALNIARLEHLARIEGESFFTPDPVLRLAALLPSDPAAVETLSRKLKLSNADAERLVDLAGARERVVSYLSVKEMRKLSYWLGAARFKDRVFLKWAEDPKESNAVQWRALLSMAESFPRPKFPLSGRDVMLAGVPEGPLVGQILKEVEDWWVDADFIDDEFSLAERLKAVVQATAY